jgi:hypothetical protein
MQPISITRGLVSSKLVLLVVIFSLLLTNSFVLYSHGLGTNQIYFGVNMKGYYTSMPQSRTTAIPMPENFFDHSLKLISNSGMNHVRFVFYWESYVRDPINFMLELQSLTINFIPLHGSIHKEERASLHTSFKTTQPILLGREVDLNIHLQKYGGQIGGIDL